MGTSATRAHNKYNVKAYDRINFVVPKGEKTVIQEAAKVSGESLNAFILRAVRAQMEQVQKEMAKIEQ